MSQVRENCFKFGEDKHLSGILTEPRIEGKKPVVVLVNAGLVPKFGPFRLYVELARHLAKQGVMAFRFDLSGIGDSLQRERNLPLKVRTRSEINEALNFLSERKDVSEIILAGLCSGAEDSFRYAENDPRVKRVILIDPFSYETPAFKWRYLFHRVGRRLLRALGLYKPALAPKKKALIDYKYMEFEESSRILKQLIDRKVRIHFIYTGGMRDSFNHRSQLKAMFREIDFKNLVTLDHFPEMDHTQVFKEDRDLLLGAIGQQFA